MVGLYPSIHGSASTDLPDLPVLYPSIHGSFMYLPVQVLILIHGNTQHCTVIICHLTESLKNCFYWCKAIGNGMTGIALAVPLFSQDFFIKPIHTFA